MGELFGQGFLGELAPGGVALRVHDFVFDGARGLQEELADVGHERGVARRDAVLGDGGVELAEDGVYVGGGEKFAGGSGGQEFADAFGFEELAVFARVMDAVVGMVRGTGHAAVTAVGETELATESGLRF